ncbi:hypothetical protein SCLCIDRAFT_130746, partial [Scleroderma citrinum Foug A]
VITVILQMHLYALYHGSKRLLVYMVSFFVAEVGIVLWILISNSLFSNGTSLAFSLSQLCVSNVTPAYSGYLWVPSFTFEVILALLAVWAGIKHFKQKSRPQAARFNISQLVDSLIHGNVIYFVCPLITFVLFLNDDASLKLHWLAQSLPFGGPITICAGCRLILSIREVASSQHLTSVPSRTMSAFVAHGSWRGEDSSHIV